MCIRDSTYADTAQLCIAASYDHRCSLGQPGLFPALCSHGSGPGAAFPYFREPVSYTHLGMEMLHKPVFDSSEIHTLLTLLGADLHYIGYRYTEYALLLMKEDEECIHSVTKCLYPVSYTHLDVYKRQEQIIYGVLADKRNPGGKNGKSKDNCIFLQ